MAKLRTFRTGLAFHVVCGIIVWFLVFNAAVGGIGYWNFTHYFREEYGDTAFRTAETAVEVVDGDRIDEYLEHPYGEDYERARNLLDILCQKQASDYIYVLKADPQADYARYQLVFMTAVDDGEHTLLDINGDYRDTTDEEHRQLYEDIYENGLEQGLIFRESDLKMGLENEITALIPVKNADGAVTAILGVERATDKLADVRHAYLLETLRVCILIIILSAVGLYFYMRRQFVKPVELIIQEAKRFAGEHTVGDTDYLGDVVQVREIGQLAYAIEAMQKENTDYMTNLARVTAERERIDSELALAKNIQANVLPSLFPAFPERTEFDVYATMTPAKEVGGDFYDFFLLDDNHLGLVMADVAGKGVPAALFMMATKNLIKSHALLGGTPAKVLAGVNGEICKNNADDMFVTVWFGILTISTGDIIACNAGHEYPVIKRRGGSFELIKEKHGMAIGVVDFATYTDYELHLGAGDVLFLYTDGVPEATNQSQELFGVERMLAALNQMPDEAPEGILHNVYNSVGAFVGAADQFDDLTMLSIKMSEKNKE